MSRYANDGNAYVTANDDRQRYIQGGVVVSDLRVRSVTVRDGGLYSCTAVSDVGRDSHAAHVHVYGLPYVRNMRNVSVVAGQDGVIPCYYGGYPIAAVSWTKGKYLVLPPTEYYFEK